MFSLRGKMGKKTSSRFSEIKMPKDTKGLSKAERELLLKVQKDISLLRKCEDQFDRFKKSFEDFSSRNEKKVDKKLYGVFENREI